MVQDHARNSIDPFVQNLIRKKTKQLVGKAGLRETDRDDIEQELILKLLQRLSKFDSRRGNRAAYCVTLIESQIATLLRDRQAGKRNPRRVCSLNRSVSSDSNDQIDMSGAIDSRGHDRRLGREARSDEELAQLALDLTEVLGRLPRGKREMLESLKTESVSEIARRLKLPRSTLSDQISRLRHLFEEAGLEKYLSSRPSTRRPTG